MKLKKWPFMAAIAVFLLMGASSCNEVPAAGRSDNGYTVGSVLRINVFDVVEEGASGGPEVDVFKHVCKCPATSILAPCLKTGTTTYEPGLKAVTASATLENTGGNADGEGTTNLMIISYSVKYSSNDVGSVALPQMADVSINSLVKKGQTLSIKGLLLMTQDTKRHFVAGVIAKYGCPDYTLEKGSICLNMDPVYEAEFIFKGENDFGEPFEAHVSTYLVLADYDTCE